MHGDARGLVDGDEVIVLEEHSDGHVRGLLVPGGAPEEHVLLGDYAIVAAERRASGEYAPRAMMVWARVRLVRLSWRLDEAVEPHARRLRRDAEHGDDRALRDVVRAHDRDPSAEGACRAAELAGADPRHLSLPL